MADVRLRFAGDAKSAVAAARDTDKALAGIHNSSRSLAAGLLKLSAAVGGIYALKSAFSAVYSEMRDSDKVAKQTEAVLRSTGGAANVTAAQVDQLAGALLRKSGVDDEVIKSGENVLLTFTNIRNQVGQGNDIFNQATVAALDLSAALGQDMQSSAIQLGKALNDPVRGMTALQRVGVSFTEQQREQIKEMVKAGNVMGAQKLILAELTKEFGGSAESQRTWGAVIKQTINNVAADVLSTFLPSIDAAQKRVAEFLSGPEFAAGVKRFKQWLEGTVLPLLEQLARWADEHRADIADVFAAAVSVGETAVRVVGEVSARLVRLADDTVGLKTALAALGLAWVAWKTGAVAAAAQVAAANIVAAETTAAAWRVALIATGWGALAVAAGLAAAYVITHWEKVKRWFEGFWAAMKALWSNALSVLIGMFELAVAKMLLPLELAIRGLEKGLGWIPGVGGKIKAALEAVGGVIDEFRQRGTARMRQAGDEMMGAWRQATNDQVAAAVDDWNRIIGSRLPTPGVGVLPGATAGATNLPAGLLSPIPAGANQGIIGRPGQGTHNAADWQSRNAVDVKVVKGTPVLMPFDGVLTFNAGPSTPTASGGKILFGDQATLVSSANGTQVFITHIKVAVKAGPVKKGTVIGYAIDAGAGTHVHVATESGDPLDLVNAVAGFAAATTADTTTSTQTAPPPTAPTPMQTTPTATSKSTASKSRFTLTGQIGAGAAAIQQALTAEQEQQAAFAAVKQEWRAVWKDHFLSDSELASIKQKAGELKGSIGRATQDAVAGVEAARAGFGQAWGRFVGYALQAFDKAHAKLRESLKATLTFDGVEVRIGSGDLTPTERLLADRRKKLREDELDQAVAVAHTAEELRAAELAREDYYLGLKADAERVAANEAIATVQREFDDRTAIRRAKFEQELADIGEQMVGGRLSYKKGLAQIKTLFADYEVPFGEQGAALGQALQSALVGALDQIALAMQSVAAQMAGFLAAMRQGATEASILAAQLNALNPSGQPVMLAPTQDVGLGTVFGHWQGGIVGYAGGGVIPGVYTPVDSRIARVSPGEMISTPQQAQRALWALMNGGGGFGSGGGAAPTLNFYGHVWDRDELIEDVRREFRRLYRENGSIFGAS